MVAERLRQAGFTGCWVIALGTNTTANMELWNEDLAATLARHPNARIYRWSEDVRDEWFVRDGIPYKGYSALAVFVADALAAAFPRTP